MPLASRLRAELRAMGLDVEDETDTRHAAESARSAFAEAARVSLRLLSDVATGDSIELWIVDAPGEQTRLRARLPIGSAQAADDATLALRIAELVRASGLASRPAPASTPVAPPAAATSPVPQQDGSVAPLPASSTSGERLGTLHVALAAAQSAGGLSAFAGVDVGGELWLGPHWAAGASVLLPLGSMSHATAAGSSRTRVVWSALMLHYQPSAFAGGWVFDAGAGVAGVWLHTRGASRSVAFTDEESSSLALAPLLQVAIAHALGGRARLGAAVGAGVTVPRFLILYGERSAATWGVPFGQAQLRLELDLP